MLSGLHVEAELCAGAASSATAGVATAGAAADDAATGSPAQQAYAAVNACCGL